jgi:hypothetical protein
MQKQMAVNLGKFQENVWLHVKKWPQLKLLNIKPTWQGRFPFVMIFYKNIYDQLLEFIGSNPILNPPHVRDVMKEIDIIFNPNGLNA